MDSTLKGRFPNLNQTKSKQVLNFYHDCMLRVFDNHASRKSDYLGNVLLSTARSGDLPKLCKALEKVDLNKVDFNIKERNTENTSLLVAAEHGHDQIISILLSCGSDVTLRNSAGQTVLETAPERITELILDSVNRPGAGQPLLCQAAWQGNATVVKKLLHLNPNLNVNNKNCEGHTPLLLVTRDLDLFDKIKLKVFTENYNPTEVVSLLLHQNADCTIVDNEGRSALHLTARNHGTNARNIISLLARKDTLNVDQRDTQEYSALHCASETGDPNVLLALIDNGADVNARGFTKHYRAADGGEPAVIRFVGLFTRSALSDSPPDVCDFAEYSNNYTLRQASRGDEKTSGILVEHGANVLVVDDLGFTPVDVAKGINVQLLLKEAWTEHSQRSLDSVRVKSVPVVLPIKLDHLDAPDVIVDEDNIQEPLKSMGNIKETSKKSGKKLQGRSHSEEQTQPPQSSGTPRRNRSYSSGPSPHSRLDPIHQDIHQSPYDEGRVSPLQQKTNLGTKNSSQLNTRLNKTLQTEVIPRPIAKVAVLNIDLKGHDLHKQKSKSCSELPFTRYRVQKLSNPRACSTEVEPLINPLSLRGRSVSAVSLSSFETLPGIMSEEVVNKGNEGERLSAPDTYPEPEIVITPPANLHSDLPTDELTPRSPHNDILNKTFNSKEKPVFWFPMVQNDTNSTPKAQNSDRGFFVNLKDLETPLQKCTKCREEFKPEDLKPGTSICNLCYRDTIAKDTFWVPFGSPGMRFADPDDRNMLNGTRSASVDDRTVSIDREMLNILRKKKLSEGSLVSENVSQNSKEVEKLQRVKQSVKKTMSDSSETQKSLRRVKTATINREKTDSSVPDEAEFRKTFEVASVIREQGDDSTIDDRESFGAANINREQSVGFTTELGETERQHEKLGNNEVYLEEQLINNQPKQETNELDLSFVKQQENELQTTQNTSDKNAQVQMKNDSEEANSLSVEKGCNILGLTIKGNLKESQKCMSEEISNGKSLESTKKKKRSPNFVSCEEFEKCRQTLECLCTDMMCLQANNIAPDVISHLSGQSKAEKCPLVNQSTREKGPLVDQSTHEKGQLVDQSTNEKGQLVDQSASEKSHSPEVDYKDVQKFVSNGISCCNKQQPATLSEKLDPSMQVSGGEGCSGVMMGKTNQLGSEQEAIIKTMDNKGFSKIVIDMNGYNGVKMDKPGGIVMDKTDNLGNDLVNTDVTPHQVVIVNPFPSPVPPKAPIVNVTSNCQCDRFASLAKNSGTGGKKKGRGKRSWASGQKTGTSGQNSEANSQKTGGKSKKAGQKDKDKGSETAKQGKGVISASKKGKRKIKDIQTPVKEISVIQTELKADMGEKNDELTPRNTTEDILLGTNIASAAVRQATFVKEKFSVLSPIPEASRSGSSVQESSLEGFPSNPDIFPSNPVHANDIPSTKGRDIISVVIEEMDSSMPRGPENEDNTVMVPRLSHVDDSQSNKSELNENISENNDKLDDLIQEILNETDELEKNHAKPHVSRKTNTEEHAELITDTNVNANAHARKAETFAISKNDVAINFQSKETFVTAWLIGQHRDLPDYNRDTAVDHRLLSEDKLDSSDSSRNSSVNNRDSSEFFRAAPSVTNATDSSYGSGGSTPRPPTADLSSDFSTLSDDTLETTSGRADVISESKLGTSYKTMSEKPIVSNCADVTSDRADVISGRKLGTSSESASTISEAQSELWTTGSVTISLPPESIVSDISSQVVRSRLTRRKSETSGTASEMTSSEEEEIVWRKGNMLGKGAFGKVYCGLTNTGQMIAVKQVELITSNMTEAERQYEKLQEEVALLKSLRHENVVSYLGTCLDGGVVNIFMQFVPGGSIASVLARFGPLEERVFRYYTKQILVGVEYLHRNNVVHRDIKGGNIMLMPTGVIKLIDFGCAKRLYMNMSQSQGDLLRSMKGTPYWMAPEVIKETGYGRKSDIWSIGCTVFEMATGKPPWSHLPPMSAILAIGKGSEPPKLGKPNSNDACDFVAISMARNPDERLSAEELLGHPFILRCDGQR